jgi:hypothetical protein
MAIPPNPTFIYDSYEIIEEEENIKLSFNFIIEGLTSFNPTYLINKKYIKNKNIDNNLFNYLVFHIGLIELVSYFKCTCSKNVIIKAGYLDTDQINWFKKLYYYGLGVPRIPGKRWSGIRRQLIWDTHMPSSTSVYCTKMVLVLHRIMARRWNGIGRQQSRDLLLPNII